VTGLGKVLRAVVGIVVVVVLFTTVNSWYGQYKLASKRAQVLASKPTTNTVEATVTIPVQGSKLAILADGVVLHSAAATSTKTVRALKKGELLVVIGVAPANWLQVRDARGKVGFVLNNPAITKVQK
jgi:hypothetical protein